MLALIEMNKTNFTKALNYLSLAKLWPENMGVGKLYEADIDARLEDRFFYLSFGKWGGIRYTADARKNNLI